MGPVMCDRAGCEHGHPAAVSVIHWRWRWSGFEPPWQDYPVCAACRDVLWPMFQTPDIDSELRAP